MPTRGRLSWTRLGILFAKLLGILTALAALAALGAFLALQVRFLEAFSIGIFAIGLLLIIASMFFGLLSAPPRFIAWIPRKRAQKALRRDNVEPSQEQFVFTLLLFASGFLMVGVSVALGYL
jgi:hypothetical protein